MYKGLNLRLVLIYVYRYRYILFFYSMSALRVLYTTCLIHKSTFFPPKTKCFLSNIHTMMNAPGSNLGFNILSSDTL